MPRFFTAELSDTTLLTGEDARHIALSLRMKTGDALTLCDGQGTDAHGVIDTISPDVVSVKLLMREVSRSEPDTFVTLYQALPKGDKLEFIVQKAVELGVGRIVPILTQRCISRPDPKAMEKKRARLEKIAQEAAKQSGRGRIPAIGELLSLQQALDDANGIPGLLFYEGGGASIGSLVAPGMPALAAFIGSEGGFSSEEVALMKAEGLSPVTLGPRILRCETAPLAALSILMYATGNC